MPTSDNYYCGMGPVPKGKVRAPPEYCLKNNQVRYYGIVAIDPELLQTVNKKGTNLIKEQLKLKKIGDDAKILLKEVQNIKIILEDKDAKASQMKRAQKRMDELLAKRDKLVKRLKTQKIVVEAAEANAIESEKAAEKAAEKSPTKPKTSKKSSSKTKKSSSKTKKSSSKSKKSSSKSKTSSSKSKSPSKKKSKSSGSKNKK